MTNTEHDMTPTKLTLAVVALMLGTTTILAPTFSTAQETAPAGETTAPADAPMDPVAGDPGKGPGRGMFDFAAMDANKDGKVTQAEITAFRTAEIAGLDADKNGLISEAEFTAQISKRMQDQAGVLAKARIAAQDVDGDGQLSIEELAARPVPAGLLAKIDTDGDAAISQAEFDAAKEKMRARMDDGGGDGHGGGKRHHRGGDAPDGN
jgi:hypothetical protein